MTLAVRLCYLQEDEVRKGWSLRDLPKSQSPEALVLEFQILSGLAPKCLSQAASLPTGKPQAYLPDNSFLKNSQLQGLLIPGCPYWFPQEMGFQRSEL